MRGPESMLFLEQDPGPGTQGERLEIGVSVRSSCGGGLTIGSALTVGE